MKNVVALLVILFSMLFLMGGSCDSGDFTTSYFCCGTSANCTPTTTQCPTNDCSTGQQTFPNGQNECSTLQTDSANNNCALYSRFGQYINIGCTGTFTEVPAISGTPILQPTSLIATPGATGSGTVNLSWSPPAGVNGLPIVYTIFLGTATGAENFLATNVSSNSFPVNSLTSGTVYFFFVSANLVFEGNLAAPGTASLEASTTAP